MPVLDARALESDTDEASFLGAILHPTKKARAAAMARGRRLMADAAAMRAAVHCETRRSRTLNEVGTAVAVP